jgi:hypothetical protein
MQQRIATNPRYEPSKQSTFSPTLVLCDYSGTHGRLGTDSEARTGRTPCRQSRSVKYRLKTFPQCVVGSQAVDVMLQRDLNSSREAAVQTFNEILYFGLIHLQTLEQLSGQVSVLSTDTSQ